jgi:hypothetical protein
VERVTTRLLIAVFVALWSVGVGANECIAPKPPRLSGALCGRLFDATGAVVPNLELRVLDEQRHGVADAQADAKGDFIFPNLAKGKYRLTTTSREWLIEFGDLEIKQPKPICGQPISVKLSVSCCCHGGISKRRPPHY